MTRSLRTPSPILFTLASTMLLLGAGALNAADAHAQKPEMSDAVCQKHIQYNDRFGNSSQMKDGALNDACNSTCAKRGFLNCQASFDALAGNPNADIAAVAGDLLYTYDKAKPAAMCVRRKCRARDFALAPVIFQSPNAREVLMGAIDTAEELGGVSCAFKADIARALWYLGDPSALDTLIASYGNTKCTAVHVKNTLPVVPMWSPSPEQHAAISTYCTEKVLPGPYEGDMRNGQDAIKGCFRYMAAMSEAGPVSDDGLEFIQQTVSQSPSDQEAFRALAILDAKGSKKLFKKTLKKEMRTRTQRVKDKRGKSKSIEVTEWRARPTVVMSALALGMKDKNAKAAIASWLTVDVEKGRFESGDGFEMLFQTMPFFPADKKLTKAMEKAFAAAVEASEEHDGMEERVLRAAIGLVQAGNAKGLEVVTEAIARGDKDARAEALRGIGGLRDYYGGIRVGTGGAKVGKGGISAKQAEKLAATILKKMKFMDDRNKDVAVLAVLDLRARIRASAM